MIGTMGSLQQTMTTEPTSGRAAKKTENPLINFGFNLILPTLILFKAEGWFGIDPTTVFAIAIAFPVCYFFYDLFRRRKVNAISILGFVSILLTGGVGLLELPSAWIAVKEAAIPLLIGIAVIVSIPLKKPLVGMLLLNDTIIHRKRVEDELRQRDTEAEFAHSVQRATLWVAISFLLSALLNLVLASWIVQSPAGTSAFNDEIAKLAMWSYPIIVAPCIVIMVGSLWMLISRLQKLTGLTLEQILVGAEAEAEAQESSSK